MNNTLFVLPVVLLLSQVCVANAQSPAWWTDPETRIWDGSAGDDFAPLNVGQLKHVALMAKAYLDDTLGLTADDWNAAYGGEANNPFVSDAFDPLTPAGQLENSAVVNVGQLKRIAYGFYVILDDYHGYFDVTARFSEVQLDAQDYSQNRPYVPWSTDVTPENAAPANLGQLKICFSFVVPADDPDSDGIPTSVEARDSLDPTSKDNPAVMLDVF